MDSSITVAMIPPWTLPKGSPYRASVSRTSPPSHPSTRGTAIDPDSRHTALSWVSWLLGRSDVTACILPVGRSRRPFGPPSEYGSRLRVVGWTASVAPRTNSSASRREGDQQLPTAAPRDGAACTPLGEGRFFRVIVGPAWSLHEHMHEFDVADDMLSTRVTRLASRADAFLRVHEFGFKNELRLSRAPSKEKQGLFRCLCRRVYALQRKQQVERGPRDRSWRTCRQCYCVRSGRRS